MGMAWCSGIPRVWQLLAGLFGLCLVVNLLVVYRGNFVWNHVPRSASPSDPGNTKFLKVLASMEPSSKYVTARLAVSATRAALTTVQASAGKASKGSVFAEIPKPEAVSVSKQPLKNPHNYSYILNEPHKCKEAPDLVMVVLTSVPNFDERQAVRETWGNVSLYIPSRVVMVFLIGSTTSSEVQTKVVLESQAHHDIVQENFIDSYRNLTIKSVAMLRWVTNFCKDAKFALKSDDDMYINVPNLLETLKAPKETKFIMGNVFVGARPVTDKRSKWYTPPEQFNEKVYPKYVSGTAYAMTGNAAPDLFEASLLLPFFWLEDVFVTGLCARQAGIPRISDGKFTYAKRTPSGCVFRKNISGHRNSIAEIRKIHSELMLPDLKCT